GGERRFEAADAAADIECGNFRPEQPPFAQARDDLGGRAVEHLGGTERIQRDRCFRRNGDGAVELIANRGDIADSLMDEPPLDERGYTREPCSITRGVPVSRIPANPDRSKAIPDAASPFAAVRIPSAQRATARKGISVYLSACSMSSAT